MYEPLAADGTTRVLRTSPLKIRFDRILLPNSVTRQAVCVQPVLRKVTSPADCVAGIFLEPAWDPVRLTATYRLSPDNPPLAANTVYELTAYIPPDPTSVFGFRTFDGNTLPALVRFDFNVQEETAPFDEGPVGDHFCTAPVPGCAGDDCARSVADVLGPDGCGSCHGGGAPAEGLDLASPAGIAATALGQAAHGSQSGGGARDPEESPLHFGRSMPLLDPRVPGNSYLVYKLIANPGAPLARAIPAAEIGRVRDTLITGMPMPPDTAPHAALRPGEPEWIADWIFQGAPLSSCP